MDGSAGGLAAPGRGRGLRDVASNGFLLRLLVDKEIQVRYRGSMLGLVWSYIKPAVQFAVFYLAMGVFLQLNKGAENYAIYLFAGMALINFFTESFGNASRSIVGNGGLIKKIYLPRELFPVSSLWVAVVHFLPQVVVLLAACLFVGWTPSPLQLVSVLAAVLIVAVFSVGVGLLFATANVFFRDAENIVDLINMVAAWASPVLYLWTMVRDALPAWAFNVYMLNPLTVAVELAHYGFWEPTTTTATRWELPPHLFSLWLPVAAAVSLTLLAVGDAVFRRYEGHFAQEL